MNVKRLKEALEHLEDDTEVLTNTGGEYDVFPTENLTIETDMGSGAIVLVIISSDKPTSTSARDYEPHPGFEDINAWIWEE